MPPVRCANTPGTAQLFVQLSLQQRYAGGSAILRDLLLPATRTTAVGASRAPLPSLGVAPRSVSSRQAKWCVARAGSALQQQQQQRCAMGTTTPRRATEAIHNPQVDEEGKEMMLEITPRAAKRLSEIMARDSNPRLALRIQVESGGCHGFQYLMSLVTLPAELPVPGEESRGRGGEGEVVVREDDTIFAYRAEGGVEVPKIILDGPSLDLLKGSKVDFTMELIGSQFKIVDNPLATSSCGCGTSFDIKI